MTEGHVLILGGTTEARSLAELLCGQSALRVTTSLAGRTAAPRGGTPGAIRSGGFGGADGLAAWLREHRVAAVVDATHPFAAAISAHAADAAARRGVPLLALRRPGWTAAPGDRWHRTDSLAEAADLLPRLGARAFLSTGRQDLAAFAAVDLFCLIRCVEPPAAPLPARRHVLLARGPFTLDAERALLREHRIDVLVTKDSGGEATAAKLTAARERSLPVVVVRRPPPPPGVPLATTVAQAASWLAPLTRPANA
ncbi:cobalt-precorrin-6A reductase [Streptomyces sp. V4-01]|uniref:Cobalt-precorrin-6A reductase n=1 Tax=Actinacidiphila polyblastidii TaxID=3110430 RepID=A0ABU7PD72_9ACTN|nr:cobalt-precorrin-6A reductase [Streptomyces sp. V4-01]